VTVRSFAKTAIKSAISIAAHRTGLSRALARRYRGRGTLLALHSVVADDAFHPDETLRCPVGKLELALRWLKQQNVEFVTLDQMVARLHEPATQPLVAFTFDDGYADNLTRALPVMERFGAPFTAYVTTGMVTREIDAWWFGLAELTRAQDRIELPELGRRFDCPDRASKQRTFRAIEAAIHADFSVLPHVREAIKTARIDCTAALDREALTVEQLRTLARHPLVTIGGHTTTHRNLAQAETSAVEWEMAANRKFLQQATDTPIEHFAYPFGHARACGEREAQIARSVGFRTATTTRLGTLFAEHREHLYALPRMQLACDDTPSTLRCKIDGFYRAVQARLGDPVALM
jgi:peptidoglycan/xylan/chitin deacetylase (PgdA/CDA1 family)